MFLRKSQLVPFCQQTIQTQSLSGQEKEVAHLFQRTMLVYGFDQVEIDPYGSVIGTMVGKLPGNTILLDGHMDTVGVADLAQWTQDPFGGTIVDGKIYGRGTTDMKGSLVAMVTAVADFAQDTNRNFAGKLCVSCSVHEECFEGVASKAIVDALHPDLVIIGEPSSHTLKHGQKGRAEIVVETHGVSCHSSQPHKGINAASHMAKLILAIDHLVAPTQPLLGEGVLALTDVVSAPYPGASVIPCYCRATYDRRTLVGETATSVLAPILRVIDQLKTSIPDLNATAYIATDTAQCWTGATVESQRFYPAWLLPPDHPLVTTATAALQHAGIHAPLSHYPFCTNASYFCGEAHIPCIGYGPSLESMAHVVDEYMGIEDLEQAYHGFYALVEKLSQS